MAIPLGTNDLKIYRRHASYCTRYPGLKNKPDTYRPSTKKDQKADTCQCPIWCRGYLAKETQIVGGKMRAKRAFASLDTIDWTAAEKVVVRLYERGSLPSAEAAKTIDNGAIPVRYAAERYLQSRKDGSLNPIVQDTYDHYASLLNQRLIPFCDEQGIVSIRDFENKDVCSQFTESWRQLRRHTGELLAMTTRKTELERFRTFLRECVENEWMTKSGAEKIRFKNHKTAKGEERYGLELEEYERMMAAADSADLTAQQNRETRAATELMRWTGMRISDAHKFNDSEIVRNETGHGWNADFIQKKTKRRCATPLPEHVVEMLHALPGQMKVGKKYFSTCTYTALRMRIDTLAERAQKEKPFTHAFSPHCLRHYAASRTMPHRRRSLKPVERAFCEIRVEYPRGIVRSPRSPTNAYQPVGREWWIGLPDRRRGAETTVRRQRTTLFHTTETPLRKPYHPQISGLEKAPTMPHR